MADNITQAYGGVITQEKVIREKLFQEKHPTLTADLDAGGNAIKNLAMVEVEQIVSPSLDEAIAASAKSLQAGAALSYAPKLHTHPELIEVMEEIADEKVALGLASIPEATSPTVSDISGLTELIDSIACNPVKEHDHPELVKDIEALASAVDSALEASVKTLRVFEDAIKALKDHFQTEVDTLKEDIASLTKRLSAVEASDHEVKVTIMENPSKVEASVVTTDKTYIYVSELPSHKSLTVTDVNGEAVTTQVAGKEKSSMVIFKSGSSPYTITLRK